MRVFDYATSHKGLVENLDVARWEQYSAADGFPFKAMWYSVPPNSESPLDGHPEFELSVVLRGTAVVQASGSRTVVEQGNAFLLDSTEKHVIINTSPDEPLLIFSAYWMPDGMTEGAADE